MSSKFLRLTWRAVAPAMLLAGCSSKPEVEDIKKSLEVVYECSAAEVRDVKKLNGEPGPQGAYDVAMSYTVTLKGGEEGAKKMLTEWLYLRHERNAVGDALQELRLKKASMPGGDQASKALQDYDKQISARIGDMFQCAGKEIDAVFAPLFQEAWDIGRAPTGPVELPIGARISRTGRMVKSENGWYLKQMALGFDGFDGMTTKPMTIALPASKVPALLAAAKGTVPSEGERTLTGLLKLGTADSCLAVTTGQAEKCYGLPSDPAQAQRILSACGQGEECSITGQFDDNAETLSAVSNVERAAR